MLDREEVAAYEVFTSDVDAPASIFVSTLATAGTFFGVAALSVAIFGSCPTIYSQTDTTMYLESELFSNSIAPLFEKRDVSAIMAKPDPNGSLKLEVRNEALETHYINHLELLQVVHDRDARVVPAGNGNVLTISNLIDPVSAIDINGEDHRTVLLDDDSLAYSSDITGDVGSEVQWDQIELVFSPEDSDAGALYLNLRNSLFTTVLLYDYLLASQGVESLNWVGKELQTVSGAVALGDFNHSFMGLQIEQRVDGIYHQVGRIENTGPIAWRELAVPISMTTGDSVHIRLKFLADVWRIDEIKLATQVELPEVNYLKPAAILDSKGAGLPGKTDLLASADDKYLVTYPGERFYVLFDVDERNDKKASYLLAGQGYYIEWIREEWIEKHEMGEPVVFTSELVMEAQQRWRETKDEFEQKFFDSKVAIQ
ncbi:hypothetical protein NC796_16795 [Aliifodinibius sp. S!AR15-10]|uniref:hypothetical protein n=1 Tax=Aliifodinibius sp. S!AR15-10 TaxID=2950437 RepID=UPI002860E401|nr:hypothetical protein [Aliifodinibius sp. S!AR15-10]MDR8392816.1 hypothetical protein [Aliifodinibius sp. S!AR15-10]